MGRPNLALAGFMGAGKSTAGLLVARLLGMPFVDTDALIEVEAGMSVQDIFARHGEAHFRGLEKEACQRLAAAEGGRVMALGGGALLDPANRAEIEASSVLVLLTCEPDVLFGRLEASALRGERPLLEGDFRRNAGELLAARKAVYDAVGLRVDTTNLMPEQVADELAAIYMSYVSTHIEQ